MIHGLFHKDKPIVGLDISTTGMKVMAIDPKRMVVLGYGSSDLDPTKVQASIATGDGFLADALAEMFKSRIVGHLPSNHVVASVPTSRTYSRTMTVPVDAQKGLAEAVQLEVEQYIPIVATELNVDYQVIERNKKELTVLISAVPKRNVDSVVGACRSAGLEVVMVEPGMNAAARLIRATEEGHLPSIIIDIGAATSDIGLLDDGNVRLTGSVAIGGHTFTLRIAKGLNIPLEEAHQLKVHSGLGPGPRQQELRMALYASLGEILSEIRKLIRYYNERIGVQTHFEQIIIVGGGSDLPGLGEAITEAMEMPARVGSPWGALRFGRLEQPTRQLKPRYITAAGLAIVNPKEIWV